MFSLIISFLRQERMFVKSSILSFITNKHNQIQNQLQKSNATIYHQAQQKS